MLTQAENDRLTRVGAGTPMGELLRRYWHPIAASAELNDENPTKEIRIMGEDLVLFRDTSGRLGCIEPRCAHRKAHLGYGIPEENGLRCPYHGWVYDTNGQCVDQPSEPVGSRFKDKIKLKSYAVEEKSGLIFVYMGPDPVPLLPQWDLFVWDGVKRQIEMTVLPCNWLQCMDNSLDPVHFEWLHVFFGGYIMTQEQGAEAREEWKRQMAEGRGRHHVRIAFDSFEHGIIKRRLLQGETEEDQFWRVGHPIVFPNILRVGQGNRHGFQFRVPIDDTHTLHMRLNVFVPAPGETAEPQDEIPVTYIPLYNEKGRVSGSTIPQQDHLAWAIQGDISDRTTESLGVTDVGIIKYRKLLEEQMNIVADGGEPMNVFRDPAANQCILLQQEHSRYPGYEEEGGPFKDLPIPSPQVDAFVAEGAPPIR